MHRPFSGDGTTAQPLWQINFENAKEVEREDQNDRAHEKHEIGIGELRCPDGLASRRFNDHQDKRQAKKLDENSGDEGEATAKNAAAVMAGLLHNTENLQSDQRQNLP